MERTKSPGGRKFLTVMAAIAAIATAAGCGSSGSGQSLGTIDDEAELGALMDAIGVPMAGVFSQISAGALVAGDSRSARAALTSPVSCPSGGSVSYTATGNAQATFTSCDLGGVVVSGTLVATVSGYPTGGGVILGGGTLTFGGNASGTLTVVSGTLQWTNPINDANTYWEIVVRINGATRCAWSGGAGCR